MTDGASLVFSFVVMVATVVVAWATVRYTKLNAALVEETRLLRKAQTDPRISFFIRPQKSLVMVDLIIRNDGYMQARNLRVEFYPDARYFENRKLSEVDFFQYMPSLQPGEQRVLPIYTGYLKHVDDAKQDAPEIVVATVTYDDILGNKKKEQFPLPFKSYSYGETWASDNPLHEIAKSLNGIEAILKQSNRR